MTDKEPGEMNLRRRTAAERAVHVTDELMIHTAWVHAAADAIGYVAAPVGDYDGLAAAIEKRIARGVPQLVCAECAHTKWSGAAHEVCDPCGGTMLPPSLAVQRIMDVATQQTTAADVAIAKLEHARKRLRGFAELLKGATEEGS